MVLEMGRLFQ
jgi:hypothetical protein